MREMWHTEWAKETVIVWWRVLATGSVLPSVELWEQETLVLPWAGPWAADAQSDWQF
jgi:hypothetical protein